MPKVVSLLALATALPEHRFSTQELMLVLRPKLSDEMVGMIRNLGVEERYSALSNYPSMLCGEPMRTTTSATEMSVEAARRCLRRWGGDPSEVGLLIAATNTPSQLLPSLVAEVSAKMHAVLSRTMSTLSMQAQGCAVLLKAIEVAGWYVAANRGRKVLIIMAESHTPYIPALVGKRYFGFRELVRMRRAGETDGRSLERQRLETTYVIQAMLFGDGAVALLFGDEAAEGLATFSSISHLTNDAPEDVELLAMEGGSLCPEFEGKPNYLMRANVPQRGAHYALRTVRDALAHPGSPVSRLEQVNHCLIHTGSRKILDGVCAQLELAEDSPRVALSYEILRRYGNLSSASTGFMLAARNFPPGPALVVSFGVGFTGSAGLVNFK